MSKLFYFRWLQGKYADFGAQTEWYAYLYFRDRRMAKRWLGAMLRQDYYLDPRLSKVLEVTEVQEAPHD